MHSIAMNINTVKDLRNYYVYHGGFSGGWNVLLESFNDAQACGHSKLAVSNPVQTGSWLIREFSGLAREVEIGGGMAVLVVEDWDALVKRVKADALRGRLLVMITGTLIGEIWDKAIKFSGRTDGLVRRSFVGVPVGQPYWYPTEAQLASVN